MKFLAGEQILTSIRASFFDADRCDLAVAYWGRSGPGSLSFQPFSQIRIICDARSGVCNPHALSELLKTQNIELRTRDKLHSKVYWTPSKAIVGSANASANGLGEEGLEAGNIEAAVEFTEPNELKRLREWFQVQWLAAEPVDAGLIEAIRPLWKNNRNLRRRSFTGGELLASVMSDTTKFEDRRIRLIAYHVDEHSDDAKQSYRGQASKLYSIKDQARFERSGELPLYEDRSGSWDIDIGDHVIDHYFPLQSSRLASSGMWRVVKIDDLTKGRIIFLEQVDQIYGLRFDEAQQAKLKRAMAKYIRQAQPQNDAHGNLVDLWLHEVPSTMNGFL